MTIERHVQVGERLFHRAPELVGHVIVGGGHFVEMTGTFVQEFSRAYQSFSRVVDGWERANRLTAGLGQERVTMISDVESRAWESFMEIPQSTKEFALSLGSAMAGDLQGTLEHAVAGTEHLWNETQQKIQESQSMISERISARELDRRNNAISLAEAFERNHQNMGTIENSWDRDCGRN